MVCKIYSLFLFSVFILNKSCNENKSLVIEESDYEYVITDKVLFENSYLNKKSFGYIISNYTFEKDCGIKVMDSNFFINKEDEYIITIDYKILNIYVDSKKIENEGLGNTKLKPLDVILDKKAKTNKLHIYKLKEKNKYRLIAG